jgi:hypothetical protein
MKHAFTLLAVLLLLPLAALQAAESIPELWKDYDPNHGDFKEVIVKQETRDGVFSRDSYISAYVLGEEIRVYCRYSVRDGLNQAPGLLSVHGWMGAPAIDFPMGHDRFSVSYRQGVATFKNSAAHPVTFAVGTAAPLKVPAGETATVTVTK